MENVVVQWKISIVVDVDDRIIFTIYVRILNVSLTYKLNKL